MSTPLLKWVAIISFVVSMVVLIGGGMFAINELPPHPDKVVAPDGKVLFRKSDILAGQEVYQRYGLMDHGAVWGHGSQRGPEFSATSLHLMSLSMGNSLSEEQYKRPYERLDDSEKGFIDFKRVKETKSNRYDPSTDTLTLSPSQVKALEDISLHWGKVFKDGERRYGLLPNTVPTEIEREQISRFFFWTAWVASTSRPGKDYSYTNNWPAKLVGLGRTDLKGIRAPQECIRGGNYLWFLEQMQDKNITIKEKSSPILEKELQPV